jgi:hypothetical protein
MRQSHRPSVPRGAMCLLARRLANIRDLSMRTWVRVSNRTRVLC